MHVRRALVAVPLGMLLATTSVPSFGRGSGPVRQYEDPYGFQGEGPARIRDRDARLGSVAPTVTQRNAARALGATVRWNRFGTPHVVTKTVGHLSAPRSGKHADIARAWVAEHRALFRLSAAQVAPDRLELIADTPFYEAPDQRRRMLGLKPLNTDVAHAVLFRQRFGTLNAAHEGLLNVGVTRDGAVTWVSSSVTPDATASGTWKLDAVDAWRAAAADVGRATPAAAVEIDELVDHAGFTTMSVDGWADVQRARKVALPTPRDGVRAAWETVVLQAHPDAKNHPTAFLTFVDAETGEVLVRLNRVDHFDSADEADKPPAAGPYWRVFPAYPDLTDPGTNSGSDDDREYWCWSEQDGCDFLAGHNEGMRETATPFPYDAYPPAGAPTFTTKGNNAETAPSYVSHLTPDNYVGPVSPTRQYDFPFTDQWFANKCASTNFASPQRNDIDAATVNLFIMHNRMHDWAYFLGWTESTWNMQRYNFGEDHPDSARARANDPETGQAQAGAIPGGIAFLGRDNANQITLQDGVPGVTNQYLWHPLQAGFYSACVDGAYDMSIVAHEVGHAIQHRMTAGPDAGLSGNQGGAMGESWSDLTAIEFLNGYGFVPREGEDTYAVAPYATGSPERGIRNYNMSQSPLNYSNLGYDGNGTTSPHADGEIWSATQFAVRQKLVDAYNATHPYTNKALQLRCADGLEEAKDCPGNRRWVQIMHDAFLLQPGAPSMLDARDAQLAADKMRFAGRNQKLMWDAYAARGMGETAESDGSNDADATPGWSSPLRADEGRLRFQVVNAAGGAPPAETEVFVGVYEARAVPTSTLAGGAAGSAVSMVPGTYDLYVRAPGFGHHRFQLTVQPGESRVVQIPLRPNHASGDRGAEAAGDGGNFEDLIDETETSNWASVNAGDVRGKQVTVALAGGRQPVVEVNVSSALRPAASNDDYDTIGQSRFSALRSFEILTCDATAGADCESDEGFTSVYTSPADAFPAGRPRPLAPNIQLRSFDVRDSNATHVRIKVLENQCTGGPAYTAAANPMADPASNPDCVNGFTAATATSGTTTNTQSQRVRIAELQVFSLPTTTLDSKAPPKPGPQPPKPGPKPPQNPNPRPLPSTGLELPLGLALAAAVGGALLARRARRTTG